MLLKTEKLNLHPLEMTIDDTKNEATTIRFGGGGSGGGGESATSSESTSSSALGSFGATGWGSPEGNTGLSSIGSLGSDPSAFGGTSPGEVGHVSPAAALSESEQAKAEQMGKAMVGIGSPSAHAGYSAPGQGTGWSAAQAAALTDHTNAFLGNLPALLSLSPAKAVVDLARTSQALDDVGVSLDGGETGYGYGVRVPQETIDPFGQPEKPAPSPAPTPSPVVPPAPPAPAPVTPSGPATRVVVPTVTIPTPAQQREMAAAEIDKRNELEARRRAAIAERRRQEQEEALRTYSTAIKPPAFYEERTALERSTATPKRRILSNPRNA